MYRADLVLLSRIVAPTMTIPNPGEHMEMFISKRTSYSNICCNVYKLILRVSMLKNEGNCTEYLRDPGKSLKTRVLGCG
jgi:hypothetical protein